MKEIFNVKTIDPFFYVFFVVIILIIGIQFIQFINRRRYLKMDYEWYTKTHPQAMRGKKATCYACGSPRIVIRPMMNKMYLNIHTCSNCGKQLYYSPEK